MAMLVRIAQSAEQQPDGFESHLYQTARNGGSPYIFVETGPVIDQKSPRAAL